jgi:hypothetical protein
MHALVAFAIGPIGRYVVLAGLLLAIVGGTYLKIRSDILAAERARTVEKERAHEAAAKRELDKLIGGDDSIVRRFDRE